MTVWHIYTNEHPYPGGLFVSGRISEEQIRRRMFAYTNEKLKEGKKLKEIIYTYSRVFVQNRLP